MRDAGFNFFFYGEKSRSKLKVNHIKSSYYDNSIDAKKKYFMNQIIAIAKY